MLRSGNPALRERIFESAIRLPGEATMTVNGTAWKTLVLLAVAVFSGSFPWGAIMDGRTHVMMPALLTGMIGGLVVALVTIFKPHLARWTAPIYAALQGLFLGAITALYHLQYAGLPVLAVMLTAAVFVTMLLVYRSGLIQVTDRFRMVIVSAIAGIMLLYVATILLSFFGINMPVVRDATPIGIGFSVVVVAIASLALLLDFDLVDQGVKGGAPAHMEWYGAFALMVGLVWLYIEILRLLSKLRR